MFDKHVQCVASASFLLHVPIRCPTGAPTRQAEAIPWRGKRQCLRYSHVDSVLVSYSSTQSGNSDPLLSLPSQGLDQYATVRARARAPFDIFLWTGRREGEESRHCRKVELEAWIKRMAKLEHLNDRFL